MEIHIGLKHDRIVHLRDELTKAIDANPEGGDGRTEVTLYGPDHALGTLVINNDDMERAEVHAEEMYAEVER